MSAPKILFFDIETRPMEGYFWSCGQQYVGIEQITQDWFILSWAAKWHGEKEVMYQDLRKSLAKEDKPILGGIWDLIDEADILVTQNGKDFDMKKLNARFIINGYPPPSPCKHYDTLKLNRKNFGHTSNKLAYVTDKLNSDYKKLKHSKFPGLDLWKECIKGNLEAWKEMEKYNKYDVLALEELWVKMRPWDTSINHSLYREADSHVCTCGSEELERRGFYYTPTGKFQRYRCKGCYAWTYSGKNLFKGEVQRGTKR